MSRAKRSFTPEERLSLLQEAEREGYMETCRKYNLSPSLLVSRLRLTATETGKAWQQLTEWAANKKESKIVRVNSIQGLFSLLQENKKLERDFNLMINEITKENIPSLNARIRKIRNANRTTKALRQAE